MHCAHLLPAGKSQQRSHYNIPCQGSTSKLDKIYQEVRGSCATSRHAAGRIRVDQNELELQKRVLNTICLNQGVQGSSSWRCIGSPGIRINSGINLIDPKVSDLLGTETAVKHQMYKAIVSQALFRAMVKA